MLDDVLDRSALAQSSLLRAGSVSVEELTRASLDRIARRDPSLHAFVQQIPRRALATARSLDAEGANALGRLLHRHRTAGGAAIVATHRLSLIRDCDP